MLKVTVSQNSIVGILAKIPLIEESLEVLSLLLGEITGDGSPSGSLSILGSHVVVIEVEQSISKGQSVLALLVQSLFEVLDEVGVPSLELVEGGPSHLLDG